MSPARGGEGKAKAGGWDEGEWDSFGTKYVFPFCFVLFFILVLFLFYVSCFGC